MTGTQVNSNGNARGGVCWAWVLNEPLFLPIYRCTGSAITNGVMMAGRLRPAARRSYGQLEAEVRARPATQSAHLWRHAAALLATGMQLWHVLHASR